MSLFLITGVPGSGKTTVCNELKRRGFDAYDADNDGLAQWFNNETGQPLKPGSETRTQEFITNHARNIAIDRVQKLNQLATPKNPIFICGDPENETALLDLFAGIFALTLDKETIRGRLAKRTGNNWGKMPHELEQVLVQHTASHERYANPRYVVLDASQAVAEIVDAIIDLVKNDSIWG